MIDDQEIYGVVGEQAFFELVDRFYENVEASPALRALYPSDLAPGKNHLAWFLIQRFGGPPVFNEKRGAPMLRRRHMPFTIDFAVRDLWFDCMIRAVDAVPAFPPYRAVLEPYFGDAATFLVNHLEPKAGGEVFRQL